MSRENWCIQYETVAQCNNIFKTAPLQIIYETDLKCDKGNKGVRSNILSCNGFTVGKRVTKGSIKEMQD